MTQASPQKALLWIVASALFMQTLDTTIVNTALPAMAASLNVSPLSMEPVVVAYTLTMAMLTPASGWLADRYGTRRVYFLSVLIFVLGSVLCAAAGSIGQLVAARIVQGIGGAMLLPVGRLAVLRAVSREEYIAALAFISIAGQLGPLFGPTLGGLLVETVTWHWVFLINLPIGLVGLIAIRRHIPSGKLENVPPFDLMGCALLSLCMVAFSLALDAPRGIDRLTWSLGMVGLSVVSAFVYVAYAKRRENPLFRLGLFREPNFTIGLIGNLVCRIGVAAVPFLLPLLLQVQLGYSPLASGLMMLPMALAGALAKPAIAPLIRRYGYEKFLLVTTLMVGISMITFAAFTPGWPPVLTVLQLCVFGAGTSTQFAAMNSMTLKGLNAADAGSGNSMFSMVQMLSTGLGVTIGSAMVALFSGRTGDTGAGFQWTFVCVGVITLLSALIFRKMDLKEASVHARA